MDLGLVLQNDPPAWRVVDLMRRAETLGFSHGWTFDSHVLWQEPYVVYSQILAATAPDGRRADGHQPRHPGLDGHRQPPRHAQRHVRRADRLRHRAGRLGHARHRPHTVHPGAGPRLDDGDQGPGRGPHRHAQRDRAVVPLAGRAGACPCSWPATDPRRCSWSASGPTASSSSWPTPRSPSGRSGPSGPPPPPQAATRTPSTSSSPRRPTSVPTESMDHQRDQVRWFGGMVGNHVADLVSRYGDAGAAVPQALTEYIKGRQGYDYAQHGRAGNTHADFVPDEMVDRFCLLGPGRGPPGPAAPAAGAGCATSSRCT